jgi:uncharacterized peroxidase-related enzyme
MNRIDPLDPESATGEARTLLEAVEKKLGMVPNLTRGLAHSPAALEGYLSLMGALAKGALSPRQREQIALAVAEANQCDYCLSAHSAIGGRLGLDEAEIRRNRRAESADDRTSAVLRLARRVVDTRGDVSDHDLQAARSAGLADGEIVEVVAHVALNVFTNYFNRLARTEIDFPIVRADKAA